MEYSFGKTFLKVLKNLGIVMALGALAAGVDGVGEIAAELGNLAPLFVLGAQIAFSFLIDYIKHKPA